MRGPGLALAFALGLAFAGPASAELAVPKAQDGMLAVSSSGAPYVAYLSRNRLEMATRTKGVWTHERAARVTRGSNLVAFKAGRQGPVALVRGPGAHSLLLVRRTQQGWEAISIARAPTGSKLGWPGLLLVRGNAVVAYTRWWHKTKKTLLVLTRLDARGRAHSTRITAAGFPKSFVAPPAAPVRVGRRIHVLEAYGIDGAVGTIEWYRHHRTWKGQYLDGGIGDYPVGPMLGAVGGKTVYAAWSQTLLGLSEMPVALAKHGRSIEADFLLDRAVTTGLGLTGAGPEVGANEWVSADDLGLDGDAVLWAGVVVTRRVAFELDGWLAGLASAPHGTRDLLLARPEGLSWYRLRRSPSVRVEIDASQQLDGSVMVTGRVGGGSGSVKIFRERPGAARELAGTAPLAEDGTFTFLDTPSTGSFVYRAVYTDHTTGLPYSALLRTAVQSSPDFSTGMEIWCGKC